MIKKNISPKKISNMKFPFSLVFMLTMSATILYGQPGSVSHLSDKATTAIPKPQSFTFKVYDATNGLLGPMEGIGNAHIRIKNLTKSFKVRTNSAGKVTVKHLPTGHYTIEITKQGCRTERKKLKRTIASNHLTVGLQCKSLP